MKKLLTIATFAAAIFTAGSANANSLLGEQVSGVLGTHSSTNPFDPGFITQIALDPGAVQTVGAGVEWTLAGGYLTFDMGANTLDATLNLSASDLPFNGFRFTLLNPFLIVTNVSVLANNVGGGGYWNVVVDPLGRGFGIDVNGINVGTLSLQIDTASVPESGSTFALLGLAMAGFVALRRRTVRA